ncbi:LysR family transcriptional regulator [Sphingomonas sp. 3-13AW]|uniref:LysR family transcriptional regulator n=1 Tax=Sphingomonas sp. 3-13AW TaxID=3050450 RepID=UPI003BB49ED2
MTFDGRLLGGIGVMSAVVEAGSFARAGDAIGLTQPAVSRAVARLEERIGIRIFNRSARAISLTDEGRLFYEMVVPLLSGIEEAAAVAAAAKVRVRGRLRINVDATFGHYVLAPRLQEFLDRYPELSVELFVRDAIGDFVGEAMDVAVRFGEVDAHAVQAELLLETRVLTCASPEYLATHGTPLAPQDLTKGHRCILIRDPATGRPFEWEFQRVGETVPFTPESRLLVNDTGGLVGACMGAAGVAQLLELYARDILASGRVVHLLPQWSDETFPLYAYHRAARLMPAKVEAFLDFVREIIA